MSLLNLKIGPPFRTKNGRPSSSNSTVMNVPSGLPDEFLPYFAMRPIFEFLKIEV